MVYMYVLWAGSGDPPSPWQKIATWDGKYLRLHQSNPGTTGGSSTHTHSATSITCGNCNTENHSGYNWSALDIHNHSVSVSIGSVNNDPPYYTLSLIRVDANVWLNSVRSLPQGAVVASMSSINWSELARLTSADNRLIKLGSPGSSGGSTSHVHSFSGTLASTKSCASPFIFSSEPGWLDYAYCDYHTHTISGSLPSRDHVPSNIKTRLYQATTKTTKVPANIVCFFDGTPPSPFSTITGWDGRILASGDTNPSLGGTSTHNHGQVSVYSNYVNMLESESYAYCGDEPQCAVNHRHLVTFTAADADHTPPYVSLIPAYLTQDVFPRRSMNQAIIL